MPKSDFLIRDLERENIKNNIDFGLITLVPEILRLNNYVIWFFKGTGKVPLVTALETILFESFQQIKDFSFRDINLIYESGKYITILEIQNKTMKLSLVVYLLQLKQL